VLKRDQVIRILKHCSFPGTLCDRKDQALGELIKILAVSFVPAHYAKAKVSHGRICNTRTFAEQNKKSAPVLPEARQFHED
jgi:hypothetical protein